MLDYDHQIQNLRMKSSENAICKILYVRFILDGLHDKSAITTYSAQYNKKPQHDYYSSYITLSYYHRYLLI